MELESPSWLDWLTGELAVPHLPTPQCWGHRWTPVSAGDWDLGPRACAAGTLPPWPPPQLPRVSSLRSLACLLSGVPNRGFSLSGGEPGGFSLLLWFL